MKNFRKIKNLGFALLILAFSCTGCGGGGNADTANESETLSSLETQESTMPTEQTETIELEDETPDNITPEDIVESTEETIEESTIETEDEKKSEPTEVPTQEPTDNEITNSEGTQQGIQPPTQEEAQATLPSSFAGEPWYEALTPAEKAQVDNALQNSLDGTASSGSTWADQYNQGSGSTYDPSQDGNLSLGDGSGGVPHEVN